MKKQHVLKMVSNVSKMDMVTISETIDKLKSEKRILANKVLEFTKAFKNTIAKMEKNYDEKSAEYEKKLDEIKEERREKNAIYSGHLRFCLQPWAAHALRSDQNAIYSGHLRLCQQPRAAHALRSDQLT